MQDRTGRVGGEPDKLGNQYEAAWVVRHALYCIREDGATITWEDPNKELQAGAEFTYTWSGGIEVHQAKRYNGDKTYWSLADLKREGILSNASRHALAGRAFVFVSQMPAGRFAELAPLAHRARRSASLTAFREQDWMSSRQRESFETLSGGDMLGSAQLAYDTLKRTRFEVQSEADIPRGNTSLAEAYLEGLSGDGMCRALEGILLNSLGTKFNRVELLARLAAGPDVIRPLHSTVGDAARESISIATSSWIRSVRRELLQPSISRPEADAVCTQLAEGRTVLLTGTAGSGKSAVLEQAVTRLQGEGVTVLAFRLDLFDSLTSTRQLGVAGGLDYSPVLALARVAGDGPSVLVIDQLDAVSQVSGRLPRGFGVVDDLTAEAEAFPCMRILMAARSFDVSHDERLRQLQSRQDAETIEIGPLSSGQVADAVDGMGVDSNQLSSVQRALLSNPFNLVLFRSIADQADALLFASSEALLDRFWERKRILAEQRRAPLEMRFSQVIEEIALAISESQVLSVDDDMLQTGDLAAHADVLKSEHVLAESNGRVHFFHEQFFDYAFARTWIRRQQSLVEFLVSAGQDPFRRAQVRQILQRLRDRNEARFIAELEALMLDERIRYHIKDVALAFWSNISAPSASDVALLNRIYAARPAYEERLWQQLRRTPWVEALINEGLLDQWLCGDDERLHSHALAMLASLARDKGDLVATVLTRHNADRHYPRWLSWLARFADFSSSRGLLDLVIGALRSGELAGADIEFWYAASEIPELKPEWGLELFEAYLAQSPDSFAVTASGQLARFEGFDHGVQSRILRKVAEQRPLAYVNFAVPYMLRVMELTAFEGQEAPPFLDRHFSGAFISSAATLGDDREFDEVILNTTVQSLTAVGSGDFDAVRSLVELLAESHYVGAHHLMYDALARINPPNAEWVAQLLLYGPACLQEGTTSQHDWSARQLLASISARVTEATHALLEDRVRDLSNAYETQYSRGRAAFTFLSALEEDRLSPLGVRRLQEYRRRFQETSPLPMPGVTGGIIGSPIPAEAVKMMNDEQWLKAMSRYRGDERDWETLKGGAYQLSGELQEAARRQPERFANLALRLTPEFDAAYPGAILRGFDGADPDDVSADAIFAAVRHISTLGHPSADRWLGWALRNWAGNVPEDLIDILRDHALHSPDPSADPELTEDRDQRDSKGQRLEMHGMNSARGALTQSLAQLCGGSKGALRVDRLLTHLRSFAGDEQLCVRAMASQLLVVAFRHRPAEVIDAYHVLIDAPDVILGLEWVARLTALIGRSHADVAFPVLDRMLASTESEARYHGGLLSGAAGAWWGRPEYVQRGLALDAEVRRGLADFCSQQIDEGGSSAMVGNTLRTLFDDQDEAVKRSAASVAGRLRGERLQPYATLLQALIASSAFLYAVPQFFITLQHAPDEIAGLVGDSAHRFVELQGASLRDMSTGAAGDAHYVAELIVPAFAQAKSADTRLRLLDLLDQLLMYGAYGAEEAIREFDRA